MPLLTVFTPAYNRAHTICRTYSSLCQQTCHDFEWLVIDDGSIDDTQSLLRSYVDDGSFRGRNDRFYGYSKDAPWLKITYIYQDNQGMHGAHNTAYDNITTELNTCIDSDDFAPITCVEKIADFWSSIPERKKRKYAGLVGLDITENGCVIGSKFNHEETTLMEFYHKGGRGDKKLVYRTDIVNEYPRYPLFPNERYVGLASLYNMIDQDYKLLTLNEPLVVVEYQIEGSSANMFKQYCRNPQGFLYCRKKMLTYNIPVKVRLKTCVHFVAEKILAKEWNIVSDSPSPVFTILVFPIGVMLFFVIKYKVKNDIRLKIENLK